MTIAKLLLANHEADCLTCAQNNQCELQKISSFFGIENENMEDPRRSITQISPDDSNPFFKRDLKKCILCGICVRTCRERLGVNVIDFVIVEIKPKSQLFYINP